MVAVTTGESQWSPDFDPDLPMLPLAFDFRSVGALFERKLARAQPEAATTGVRVQALQDVKYQPGFQCVSTYELVVGDAGPSPLKAIGVLHIGAEQTLVLLPNEDPELDRLGEAMDPKYMRHRLEAAPELVATLTSPPRIEALRYKPRLRCSLRYELETQSGKQVLFGKMLAQGGELLMSTLGQLDRQSRELATMPRIAPPLVYWADMRLLLQRAVDGGDELHSIAFDQQRSVSERAAWMHTAGERLAGLHSAGRPPGPSRTLRDDVDELSGYTKAIAAPDSELAREYSFEVKRLSKAEEAGYGSVPSHGAFRTDQFMIQDGELVLIDLDGYCWAEPSRDIGNLLAYIGWKAMRQPQHGHFVEQATDQFLEGYASVREPPDERRIALFEAASRLKIGGRRYRSLSFREWPLVPLLIESSRNLLGK
ncbi:MAG TPA: phosphotransferase [Actinomycetota bacterium]|nr:phosphotransferase [Actinomycetota bacterium]